jgi:hypothetical protein
MCDKLTPEENRSMNAGALIFGMSGFLGAMAFSGNFWVAAFVGFVSTICGLFFGAWMSSK